MRQVMSALNVFLLVAYYFSAIVIILPERFRWRCFTLLLLLLKKLLLARQFSAIIWRAESHIFHIRPLEGVHAIFSPASYYFITASWLRFSHYGCRFVIFTIRRHHYAGYGDIVVWLALHC